MQTKASAANGGGVAEVDLLAGEITREHTPKALRLQAERVATYAIDRHLVVVEVTFSEEPRP